MFIIPLCNFLLLPLIVFSRNRKRVVVPTSIYFKVFFLLLSPTITVSFALAQKRSTISEIQYVYGGLGGWVGTYTPTCTGGSCSYVGARQYVPIRLYIYRRRCFKVSFFGAKKIKIIYIIVNK